MTLAERIFSANFPGLHQSGKVKFPKPAIFEPPRGKLTPDLAPEALPPKHKRMTEEGLRRARELRLQRERDHLCNICGAPAKVYPNRNPDNQWGKRCDFHADQYAEYAAKSLVKMALKPAQDTPPLQ